MRTLNQDPEQLARDKIDDLLRQSSGAIQIKDKINLNSPAGFDQQGIFEVPKTLIFAKTDGHADDIIQITREEFGEGNAFCKKITYNNQEEDPKSVLTQFHNNYHPHIAVPKLRILLSENCFSNYFKYFTK